MDFYCIKKCPEIPNFIVRKSYSGFAKNNDCTLDFSEYRLIYRNEYSCTM